MKRIFALLLALCLCMSLALCVVSCNKENNSDETTAATTEAPTTEAPTTEDITTEAPTTEETTTEEITEADTGYKVRVVDTDGNGIKGVWVQVCKGEMCSSPKETDADGYVKFPEVTDDGRQAKIGYDVDGYVVDTNKYYDFEAGSFEMTIVLEKAA